MKVLIAEDDRVSRRMLRRDLERWGHEVVEAQDGKEAWGNFQQGEFAIVISDWMMPEMDGLELVQRIRQSQQSHYVYFILLTAKNEKEDTVRGMEAGADDFLSKPFDRNELRVRLHAGERIIALERNLAEQNRLLDDANRRMKRDLDAAALVQQSLLPTSLPQTDKARFAWKYKPCDELAGDILNIFPLDDKHVGMYVVDVSGHGVAASLLAVAISRVMSAEPAISSLLLQPAADSEQFEITPPAQVAKELNARFPMEKSGERYFTILYGVLNTETRQLRYVSAGHPPLIHCPANGEPFLHKTQDFAIGWVPDAEYGQHTVDFQEGDRFFLYSDGIPEAMNPASVQFGDERFLSSVNENASQPLEDVVTHVLEQVESWCADEGAKDDLSILGIEVL